MKPRLFSNVFTVALIAAVLSVCLSKASPVSAQSAAPADDLDTAIRAASDYLNKQLPRGNKLAILNVQSEFPALSEYIIDELIANMVNDRGFSVGNRQQLNTIRTELKVRMSGEVSDDSARSIGHRLGAQIIISGAISRIGYLYRLRVRALSVQSAQIAGQFNRNISNGPAIAALTQGNATGPGTDSGGNAARPPAQTAQTPAPAAAQTSVPVPAASAGTYKIGDTGPAGGIIFYDNGNDFGGWRYLEAAPKEAEFTAKGAINEDSYVDGTKTEIGEGRNNTQVIVDYSLKAGLNMPAARQCDRLQYDGYDDWFIPSQMELALMYLNLKDVGLGGFSGDMYCSSSLFRARYSGTPSVHTQRFSDIRF